MTGLALDWSTAEVHDGTLAVAFSDKAPREWREAFARATTLLSHGTWEVNELKAHSLRIAPVHLGEEERVKHFLDSAMLEANATIMSEDELFDPEPTEEDKTDGASGGPSPDEELTARFRAFA